LCDSRSHYKWHRQTWVQSEASSAGELLVWLASLEPCFQVRWWLFTCPERGEKRNLFHSCQHLVTLISFLTLGFDTWECYETRGVDQDHGKVLFKGSAWHRWHFLFFRLSFFILSLLRREMCHSLRHDFSRYCPTDNKAMNCFWLDWGQSFFFNIFFFFTFYLTLEVNHAKN